MTIMQNLFKIIHVSKDIEKMNKYAVIIVSRPFLKPISYKISLSLSSFISVLYVLVFVLGTELS